MRPPPKQILSAFGVALDTRIEYLEHYRQTEPDQTAAGEARIKLNEARFIRDLLTMCTDMNEED